MGQSFFLHGLPPSKCWQPQRKCDWVSSTNSQFPRHLWLLWCVRGFMEWRLKLIHLLYLTNSVCNAPQVFAFQRTSNLLHSKTCLVSRIIHYVSPMYCTDERPPKSVDSLKLPTRYQWDHLKLDLSLRSANDWLWVDMEKNCHLSPNKKHFREASTWVPRNMHWANPRNNADLASMTIGFSPHWVELFTLEIAGKKTNRSYINSVMYVLGVKSQREVNKTETPITTKPMS